MLLLVVLALLDIINRELLHLIHLTNEKTIVEIPVFLNWVLMEYFHGGEVGSSTQQTIIIQQYNHLACHY